MITLATIAERSPSAEPLVTVDFNGDERDPAWCAFCESGYWQGTWFHADEFAPGWFPLNPTSDDLDSPEWWAARDAAERAAQEEGEQHRADVHID
jgi:hypothetical protein